MQGVIFQYTCSCTGDDSKKCETHKKSVHRVFAKCKICGEEIVLKLSQYNPSSLFLCRRHKATRERYMNFVAQHQRRGTKTIVPSWDEYLLRYEERDATCGPQR